MNRSSVPRVAALIALLVELALVALTLVIVWTSRSREWYIDLGGASATLDLSLGSAARWIATALLGVVGLVALTGLAAIARRARPAPFRSTALETPYAPPTAAPADDAAGLQWAGPAARPSAYQSLIAGDDVTQRIEQAVPQPATPAATASNLAEDPTDDAPFAHGPEWEDSIPGQRLKVPLRVPERRG